MRANTSIYAWALSECQRVNISLAWETSSPRHFLLIVYCWPAVISSYLPLQYCPQKCILDSSQELFHVKGTLPISLSYNLVVDKRELALPGKDSRILPQLYPQDFIPRKSNSSFLESQAQHP